MVTTIEIAGRKIGPGQPCFVIAEAGVNHNGNPEMARQLVDAAVQAGADAVKFQTWVTEKLMVPTAPLADYQRQQLDQELSQFDMAKHLELSYDQFQELKYHADRQGILFFSTPDEEDSADFLDELGVPLFKIGSGEMTNLSFLRHVALKGKPIILSTGMSNLSEVEEAVRAIEETGNQQLVLLHCVSNYPAKPEDCNLLAIDTLRVAFQYPVGFSDHTVGTHISIGAVSRGACVLEKHFTLDGTLSGPDHSSSLEPSEFAYLVRTVSEIESALGTGRKSPANAEISTKKVVQKTIVAARDIPAGKMLEPDDLMLRRTSGGLPPKYLGQILGRRTTDSLKVNQTISIGELM
tara:strand:+ start:32592 stop:33644 length:1053 start_codon:yes stop_codon:yes gene_type:complete